MDTCMTKRTLKGMDIMAGMNMNGAEHMTIRCRIRPNWIRIAVLTLVYTLISWLAFGAFCSILDGSLSFQQALFTPLGLIFLTMNSVMHALTILKKDTGCCESLSEDAD